MLMHTEFVVVPLLAQMVLTNALPEIIAVELKAKVAHFIATGAKVQGQVVGKTTLSLPMEMPRGCCEEPGPEENRIEVAAEVCPRGGAPYTGAW